jgi:hypothetical protein
MVLDVMQLQVAFCASPMQCRLGEDKVENGASRIGIAQRSHGWRELHRALEAIFSTLVYVKQIPECMGCS